jgi:hypothetical protein
MSIQPKQCKVDNGKCNIKVIPGSNPPKRACVGGDLLCGVDMSNKPKMTCDGALQKYKDLISCDDGYKPVSNSDNQGHCIFSCNQSKQSNWACVEDTGYRYCIPTGDKADPKNGIFSTPQSCQQFCNSPPPVPTTLSCEDQGKMLFKCPDSDAYICANVGDKNWQRNCQQSDYCKDDEKLHKCPDSDTYVCAKPGSHNWKDKCKDKDKTVILIVTIILLVVLGFLFFQLINKDLKSYD